MKKLSVIALVLSLCVICIGCSAQSENEKDTGGKTPVSDSATLPTAKDGGGTAAVFSIDEDENAQTTSGGDKQTTTENEGKDGKDGKSDKNDKDGKSGKSDESDDEESTSSASKELPILPLP